MFCNVLLIFINFFKPRERLKEGDEYKSQPKIGGEIIKELKEIGFSRRIL